MGRALLGWLTEYRPNVRCTIFSRDHGKHSRVKRMFPQHRYVIGDVRDYDSVELAMAGHDTVVHAAAFKYVPESETNVVECHEINAMGSLNVARAAIRTGVERVVGISTDKACQPINVYGITKLMMERIFQHMDTKGDTQFNLCRYGNVVSSTGSAIPLFRQQARENRKVKVTNPDMTRFWLSVYEGVELIVLALQERRGGTILVPRLPSLNMQSVAEAAVILELGENKIIEFESVGQRFGEKLHEDLISDVEAMYSEKVNEHIVRLHPMTTPTINPKAIGYNSGNPDKRLTVEEILAYIKEAPE